MNLTIGLSTRRQNKPKMSNKFTIYRTVHETGYMSAECASIGEALLAIECGFAPEKIVYNGPVKSKV